MSVHRLTKTENNPFCRIDTPLRVLLLLCIAPPVSALPVRALHNINTHAGLKSYKKKNPTLRVEKQYSQGEYVPSYIEITFDIPTVLYGHSKP